MSTQTLASLRVLGLMLAAGLGAAAAPGAETPGPASPEAVLFLEGDQHLRGELCVSSEPGVLRWQSPAFVAPWTFPLAAVKGAHFPCPAAAVEPGAELCFELAGGDVLFGSLLGLDGELLEIESPRLGRVRLHRSRLRSLYRWHAAALIHLGPNGLAGWKESDGAGAWSQELGQPHTDRGGAAIFGDFGIPRQAVLELELSWRTRPDFTLAFGVTADAATHRSAFRFEVWRQGGGEMKGVVLGDARSSEPAEWEYTFSDPGAGWFEPGFDSRGWERGRAGFGTHGTPGAIVRTEWSTRDIWLRRKFPLRKMPVELAASVHHDEDARVWINGQPVLRLDGHVGEYTHLPLEQAARLLREGENVIAVHCRQSGGGQYIDVGLVERSELTGDLVALRETGGEADVAALGSLSLAPGRAHLVAYLDQDAGRLLVHAPDGRPLADLRVPSDQPGAGGGGLLLRNLKGDIRLERLRIGRWSGVPPRGGLDDASRLERLDGSVVQGELIAADARRYLVRAGGEEVTIPAEQVASVILATREASPQGALRAVYPDGTRLSGDVLRVENGNVHLSSAAFERPLSLPLAGLRSLVALQSRDAPREAGPGRLELEGVDLTGRLADGQEQDSASCIVWQPTGSDTASALRAGLSGRVTFRRLASETSPTARRPSWLGSLFGALRLPALAAGTPRPGQRGGKALHLRSGDVVPCEVRRIDESGVTFTTPLSDARFVAHDRVKAVELLAGQGPPRLGRAKRERLLMLPRMQSPSPPTHLIRSRDGDYLRGNVVSLDDKLLRVEVRSEVREIPRSRVSHVIWLHKDELAVTPATPAAVAAMPFTRVQARKWDGNRLTFLPERVAGTALFGKSDVLGACRVELGELEELLIGADIEAGVGKLPYQGWKLHKAIDPIYIQVLDGPRSPEPTPGLESPLVGKPAPEFELDLLDGKKYRLSSSRGKIVVLDFWATWCGPCLQTLPQIERHLRDIEDSRVELIAINLEEPASQIVSTLERHKLHLTVALDRDGVVAARYQATAIPQTVVIDKEGKVARLFVGGGGRVAEQVRDVVRDLIAALEEKPG